MQSYLIDIIRNDEQEFLKSDSIIGSLMLNSNYKDSVALLQTSIIELNKKQHKEDERKLWWVKLERDVAIVTSLFFGGKFLLNK